MRRSRLFKKAPRGGTEFPPHGGQRPAHGTHANQVRVCAAVEQELRGRHHVVADSLVQRRIVAYALAHVHRETTNVNQQTHQRQVRVPRGDDLRTKQISELGVLPRTAQPRTHHRVRQLEASGPDGVVGAVEQFVHCLRVVGLHRYHEGGLRARGSQHNYGRAAALVQEQRTRWSLRNFSRRFCSALSSAFFLASLFLEPAAAAAAASFLARPLETIVPAALPAHHPVRSSAVPCKRNAFALESTAAVPTPDPQKAQRTPYEKLPRAWAGGRDGALARARAGARRRRGYAGARLGAAGLLPASNLITSTAFFYY